MKRTNVKLTLQRRLALVRITVRELTPAQLGQVNGRGEEAVVTQWDCPTKCCPEYTY
ncbi:MAG TPA: hypothetical protein VK932_24720 [Kofleriaceae bacterium]|nr:hypothetical protein [Kofleriaceae bacterium]